jgi:uncharacterized membrane protein
LTVRLFDLAITEPIPVTIAEHQNRRFPAVAGILLGLGLGGFFDGIVLHQILQWHHMATSAGYPADTLENLQLNTTLDGLFHASTYAFTAIGLLVLWNKARKPHFLWSGTLLSATMLIGWGTFNIVEGIVDHHLLELHHVNETVPREHWIYWDLGFLIWGVAMVLSGLVLYLRAIRRRPALKGTGSSLSSKENP